MKFLSAIHKMLTPPKPSREKKDPSSPTTPTTTNLDFDEEAYKLFAKLNLDPKSMERTSMWKNLDPIYRHPIGLGTIYVGNQNIAEDYKTLKKMNITHVVNCTHGVSKIPNFHEGKLKYNTFPISHWYSMTNPTNASVLGATEI